MKRTKAMMRACAIGLIALLTPLAAGQIAITEWMYNGAGAGNTGEFVEFTNIGASPVDMTGWSFDDDSRLPGTVSLSGFGIVAPGQSVILTDDSAVNFATAWGLSGVVVVGGSTANLGRNDELNLFDAGANLIDRLTYGDESYPGTVRTQARSCSIPPADYAFATPQTSWVLSTPSNAYGAKTSSRGEIASPGRIVGYARPDFDQDGDVDNADFGTWHGCNVGPDVSYVPPPGGCLLSPDGQGFLAADLDQDGDVDLADFLRFEMCFAGAGIAVDPACGEEPAVPVVSEIILNGNSIEVIGTGVTVEGAKATITLAGTYFVSGTLSDGQIVVSSAGVGAVEVVLNGASIANSTTAPFSVVNAEQMTLTLAAQTTNTLTDPSTYVFEPGIDEPNACLFSKTSMTIGGTGALTVHGNFNDAIASKDSLLITGGTINITAIDDGIRGKDALTIQGGTITVVSGGDALKADSIDGPGLGVVTIAGGSLNVTSAGDGLDAETDAVISGGALTVVSGGGSNVTPPVGLSCKGVKGTGSVVVSGGSLNLNSADDGVHSNGNVTISSPAVLTIATHDDAVHADGTLHVVSGQVTITKSFEGLEGANITIDNGTIGIVSSDDAITADSAVVISNGSFTIVSGGGHNFTVPTTGSAKAVKGLVSVDISGGTFSVDSADDGVHSNGAIAISGGSLTMAINNSTNASTGAYGDGIHADGSIHISGGNINVTSAYEGIESKDITIDNGTIHVTTTDDGINGSGGAGTANYLHINGGRVVVNASGDGIDINGSIWMTGGTVIVLGPTSNGNGSIDYDVTFLISGGMLIATGSNGGGGGAPLAPSASSTQRSIKVNYTASKAAGTLVRLQTTAGGADVVTFAPAKAYQSFIFSAPALTAGASFTLCRAGTCTGTATDGLYSGGTYSGGTQTNTVTTTGIVTTVSAP